MKTLRLFGMLLVAILTSFSMTACGDDDDDNGKDGGSTPDYIGIWVSVDRQDRMVVVTLKANDWQNDTYKLKDGLYKKETVGGSLSVSGNKISISGDAPFSTATYSISGNTMTIIPDQETEEGRISITRATDDQIKKIAAWEALVLASQSAK